MWFQDRVIDNSEPDVPDTIGRERGAKLQRGAAKQPWFTKKAAEQRIKSTEQQQKKHLS